MQPRESEPLLPLVFGGLCVFAAPLLLAVLAVVVSP